MRYDKTRIKYGSVSPRKEVAAYFYEEIKREGGRERKKTEREKERKKKNNS